MGEPTPSVSVRIRERETSMTQPSATNSTPLVLFALRIAADLVGTCGSDVQTETHQGLDGDIDSVTISTADYTVTVTPTPSAASTPPPYLGMTHPPM